MKKRDSRTASTSGKKRNKIKHNYLTPKNNRRVLKEFIDFDYVDKLSEKEKDLLDQFSREYYGADFRKEPGRNSVITDKNERLVIGRHNNHRNQDTFGYINSYSGLLEINEDTISANNTEDTINELLDRSKLSKKLHDLKNSKNKTRNTRKK